MTEKGKPLPAPLPWTKSYWEGAKRRQLLFQQCSDCGQKIMYPKMFCPNCMSDNLTWQKASGRGRLYSYTVVHRYPPTGFHESLPYVVGIVTLEEGVRLMTNIIQCDQDKLACDMEVEVAFEDISEEVTLPQFRPAS